MEGNVVAVDSLGVTTIEMILVGYPDGSSKLTKMKCWFPIDVYTAYSAHLREV